MKKDKIKDKTKINLDSSKINRRKRIMKIMQLVLLNSTVVLGAAYIILGVVYTQGAFTISLDQNFAKKSGIIIFESLQTKESRRVLEAQKLEFMDNISKNWLPKNLNEQGEGSHNGENYIAYTFYVQNLGSETINYWYQVVIDDVIKNVDSAIRVMIYQNGEETVYAKQRPNGSNEADTEPFYSDEYVVVKQRADFKVDEIDKYTIVIWIEGDDPDCIDAIVGGEMKMHLEITEEQKDTR